MIASANLEKLARLFPVPLYVVGGRVRNFIISGKASGDFDICSSLAPEPAAELAAAGGFKVSAQYRRFGTLLIEKGGESYEYTCFRRDSYKRGHSPEKVEFTDDIKTDALRRDFKINAIYFDVVSKKILDPCGGLADIAAKRVSTAANPVKTLAEDGLRVMRLARIAAELGFSIKADTLAAAKKYAGLLADVSPERKRDELEKILSADKKYAFSPENAHYRGLEILKEVGAFRYIIPPLADCGGVAQNGAYHRYDVLEHSLQTVKYAGRGVRLAALMHDCGKAEAFKNGGNMHGHEVVGERLCRTALTDLRYDKKTTERASRLVALHMYDLKCATSETKLKLKIAENADIIEDLIALKRADAAGSGVRSNSPSADRLEKLYLDIKDRLPLSIKDLKIGGGDLLAAGVEAKRIGATLAELARDCLVLEKYLDFDGQLERALEIAGRGK